MIPLSKGLFGKMIFNLKYCRFKTSLIALRRCPDGKSVFILFYISQINKNTIDVDNGTLHCSEWDALLQSLPRFKDTGHLCPEYFPNVSMAFVPC